MTVRGGGPGYVLMISPLVFLYQCGINFPVLRLLTDKAKPVAAILVSGAITAAPHMLGALLGIFDPYADPDNKEAFSIILRLMDVGLLFLIGAFIGMDLSEKPEPDPAPLD